MARYIHYFHYFVCLTISYYVDCNADWRNVLYSNYYNLVFIFLGVQNLVALLSREKDDDTPNLQVLLAECFLAVYMALFAYAFTAYDSRWLYRLSAHPITPQMFATVFGGGGEKKLSSNKAQPPRPPSKNVLLKGFITNLLLLLLSIR